MIIPKILAIYLPQFYENEDNNEWWGKGFTDWESVKTAQKYFSEHNEPRVPYYDNYYDLSRKETMEWQAKLAKKYGIDGFCFYHYYFKNGKKELELPAENLLKWKEIDMPFCFNWASEPWIRSWSRISGNVWAERYEKEGSKGQNGILVDQEYGGALEWKKHFEYLLPFFLDKRYIKIEGKPVFLFYSPDDIAVLSEMTELWRKLAVQAGLQGLYLIGAHLNAPNKYLDAAIIYEPRNSLNQLNEAGKAEIKNGVRCFEYKELCKEILNSAPIFDYKTFFCGVSGYDDTPRRGKSGEGFIHSSPKLFQKQMTELLQKSISYGNELLFINAWNEWGEGMYLEPDETDKYGYLEAVKDSVKEVDTVEKTIDWNNRNDVMAGMLSLDYNVKKFKQLFTILDKWLFLEQEERVNFKAFFDSHEISTVAIYGMASLGKHLLLQMKKEKISVMFGIDRYVGQFGEDFGIYRPEDYFPEVDAIVISAYEVVPIREKLEKKYRGKIFGVEEIVDFMMKK